MKEPQNTGTIQKAYIVAIGVLFLAFELRNVFVLRYSAVHGIRGPMLWLYPILTCIPIAIYWKAASLARRQDAGSNDTTMKLLSYLSGTLMICLILLLLGDSLLSDLYTKIGNCPR